MHKLVIIGSGPAGLTAAIYAARANLEPVVAAGYEWGGQLMLTTEVENYPGFPEGIMGPDLMQTFRDQAERFGATLVERDVVSVEFSADGGTHRVTLDDRELEAESVIVATGSSARWLDLPSEQRLRGHGVSACATCDGFFFKDKEVVVVGGGDTAMEESLFLTKFASKVTIVHRRDEFRASQIMRERVLQHPKIEVLWNAEIIEVLGKETVEGVRVATHPQGAPTKRIKDLENPEADGGEVYDLACQGMFLAIGHVPNTGFLEGSGLKLGDKGYVEKPGHSTTYTNLEGVFVAGDVFDHRYQQAVTAAADGCRAAMDVEKWLEGREA